MTLTRSGNTIVIDDRVAITPGKGCRAVKGDKTKVTCTPSKAPTRVRVYTYDRNDTVVNRTGLGMTSNGGTGNDKIYGGPAADLLYGDTGADQLHGNGGRDDLHGDEGNDRLWGGDGDGDDQLSGDRGNDALAGGNGHDYLFGMDGNDREYGGPGVDKFHQTYDPDLPDADLFVGGPDEDEVVYISRSRAVAADNDGVKGDDGLRGGPDDGGASDRLDGGANGTNGDLCERAPNDVLTNCES